ncbi:hypothetical protein C8R43DRAFT_950564 [Mycena crocata]|nr:hypothetical protein C8R43DRAFT_950564 [Mycena crocata]
MDAEVTCARSVFIGWAYVPVLTIVQLNELDNIKRWSRLWLSRGKIIGTLCVSSFLRDSSTFLVTLQENNSTTVMLMTTMKWAGVGGGRSFASCTHAAQAIRDLGKLSFKTLVDRFDACPRKALGHPTISLHCVADVGGVSTLPPSLTSPSGVTAEVRFTTVIFSKQKDVRPDSMYSVEPILVYVFNLEARNGRRAGRAKHTWLRSGTVLIQAQGRRNRTVDFSSSGSGAAQYRNEEPWCRWHRGAVPALAPPAPPSPLRPMNTRSKSKVKLNDGPHRSASETINTAAVRGVVEKKPTSSKAVNQTKRSADVVEKAAKKGATQSNAGDEPLETQSR